MVWYKSYTQSQKGSCVWYSSIPSLVYWVYPINLQTYSKTKGIQNQINQYHSFGICNKLFWYLLYFKSTTTNNTSLEPVKYFKKYDIANQIRNNSYHCSSRQNKTDDTSSRIGRKLVLF